MPIDPSVALGAQLPSREFAWTPSDVQLYHLGLGAGTRWTDEAELRYLDDREPQVLPTFATVAQTLHETEPPKVSFPGIDIDLAKVVHAHQEVQVHRPIPAAGKATSTGRISELWDKGSAAVIVQEHTITGSDGAPLWTTRSSIFAKGEGGFGGERGPSTRTELPDRDPDAEVAIPTLPQQALLYRMLGDRNPLHSDPAFAKAAGFPAPILHGLCTYGLVCKAATDTVLDSDATRVTGFRARFAGVLFPGETIRARIWRGAGELTIAATVADRDDAPVLGDVTLTFQ
ncbi:MaoC family dehydratase N-terminal domain-containing protein [Nocardia farcinica]|uniref:3-alpha,7-alpha, 12-alpha-trihydroxy-5-beta-cholest-24-enoyl-CoA hydratase n=3 Tax=Nocardia farcinica TaxID=37329 RepID=Q5Z2N7_NOCFA|nr:MULTISPECIES: MaoC family dehydratase [Nocardia]MBF6070251.1 MaoC family dehydratase N-terminal domain-containing protein [Nocardia farcinica]MBF6138923.1 MaoC family dehydratase N-terminal domain-containing protein [Nocardia farcinica]MBF6187266.1 MaoC family dehydratase N-terminal domain-containing protein [Nocardia farcinica]MBF6234361.1 MaoC family dehydratase N-terminal domain-containing protein [Nocardia farcinica]MBF6258954.1 MaoC family dehydratase N-terminal domain-containing prote